MICPNCGAEGNTAFCLRCGAPMNAGGGNYGGPNAGYGNPNNAYGGPNMGYGNPNNAYGNPNMGYGNAYNAYSGPGYGNFYNVYSGPGDFMRPSGFDGDGEEYLGIDRKSVV